MNDNNEMAIFIIGYMHMHAQYCKFPEFLESGSFEGWIPNGNSLNSRHRNSHAGNSTSLLWSRAGLIGGVVNSQITTIFRRPDN